MQELITKATPTGVYIVTVRAGDKINGMTAAWVTQVSFKPKLIAVAIAGQRFTHGLIKESGIFCLNALPEGGNSLGKHFGFKSGRKVDKMKNIEFTSSLKGAPILKSAYAYVECETVQTVETGDHTLFVGKVLDCAILDKKAKPLIFEWKDFFGKKE